MLLLFNTTRRARARAQPPDPQARGPLSLWTVAWPVLMLFNTTRAHTLSEIQICERSEESHWNVERTVSTDTLVHSSNVTARTAGLQMPCHWMSADT